MIFLGAVVLLAILARRVARYDPNTRCVFAVNQIPVRPITVGKASVREANDMYAYGWRAAYTAKLNGVDTVGSRAMRITVPLSASSSITTDPAS